MPFTDGVSSISGRNSRASNVSGMTGASRSVRSAMPPSANPNDTLSNAGVLSMLKTSTDTGDIGALSFNHSRLPNMSRVHPRRGHIPRTSDSSHPFPNGTSGHDYAPSVTSRVSDTASYQRRGSFASLHSMPPSLQPMGGGRMPMQGPPHMSDRDRARDSRSYSLTSAPTGQPLPRHRSATSLRSAGHEPRHGHHLHPGHPPPMPDSRPPYVYPARLRRPGYRSPSPALSDLSAQGVPPMPSQVPRRGPMPMARPPPQSYNSDYGNEYGQDLRFMGSRPPRAMNNQQPVMYDPNPYGYRPPPGRPGPGMPMGQGPPPQHRMQYPNPPYGQQPMYPPYAPMQHHGPPPRFHRGPPPSSNMAAMGHSMFQNAARMARQLPPRADTPMSDTGPPSSDPPSSGTAPSSSNPPTPRDQTTIQVAVDPLFIDPALTDLPDSSSEPVLPGTKYFQYADGLTKLDEPELEIHHASVPPTGFVQRVKAMLESRAAVEAAVEKQEAELDDNDFNNKIVTEEDLEEAFIDLHELSAHQTPRFTVIEEFQPPVELSASPMRIPELESSPVAPKRLTRDFVKAQLGESSTLDSTPVDDETLLAEAKAKEEAFVAAIKHSPPRPDHVPMVRPSQSLKRATPNHKPRKKSVASVVVAETPDTLAVSGIDYALRFSVPADTTIITEETQSKDPFILDADTITLQHQRSKERIRVSGSKRSTRKASVSEVHHDVVKPISPLRPHEGNSRVSAVSPLNTQLLGLDETSSTENTTKSDEATDINDSTLLRLYEEEKDHPPLTPRGTKTYSKSVQLTQVTNESPTSNRLSLPPDLSNVGETTINTTSDMITDVAVRFSLPTTTITVGKPQIITIPPSSSPARNDSPQAQFKSHALDPKSARRGSVTFADQVAPLNIKKAEPRRESQGTEAGAVTIRSIIRRPSPLDDTPESSRASSTTDLRFPSGNTVNIRFGTTHLPGLKEESVEEMSLNDRKKKSLEIANDFQFPLPARIAAVKAMQERRLQESADKTKARRAARNGNRPLAETQDLPSLNFSRVDLIDKLNEALDVRSSKSMDFVRHRDISTIYCPSPQRPQSTEPFRERYTSFFCKPQDFSLFDELKDDSIDTELSIKPPTPELPAHGSKDTLAVPRCSKSGSARSLSPEEFLSVATQINRLSIPSVSPLSARLTELLPCLKNLNLDSVLANDEEVAHTIDDIHNLGSHRPETVLSTRTSAGFRTLAERAEEIVQNSTHDSILPASKLASINKALPPLPESMSADQVAVFNNADAKQSHLSGSVSAPVDLGHKPIRPDKTLLRQRTPLTEEEVLQMLPPESNPIARGLKRSLMLSGASTRPWNQDENYPWSGNDIAVDLTISSGNITRDSLTSHTFQGRRTKSLDITTTTDDIRGIDIGSITTDLDRSVSVATEQATGVKPVHSRKQSKRSIIGSITRKIGLSHVTPRKLTSPAVRSDDSLPHKPGDRYPSTGLPQPAALNLDEVRSFFSDNSSERHRNTSFRKRLTGLKGPNSSKNRTPRPDDRDSSLDEPTNYDGGSIAADRLGFSSSAHTYDGVGMGKTEFRIKRLGEKLRHLFAKGSVLIRSWSTRTSRNERVRDDWLSDSLYSGV